MSERPSLRDSGPDPADPVAEELFLIRAAVARGAVKPATIRSLLAAVEAALKHHEPGTQSIPICACGLTYPCYEVQAISRALLGEGE